MSWKTFERWPPVGSDSCSVCRLIRWQNFVIDFDFDFVPAIPVAVVAKDWHPVADHFGRCERNFCRNHTVGFGQALAATLDTL